MTRLSAAGSRAAMALLVVAGSGSGLREAQAAADEVRTTGSFSARRAYPAMPTPISDPTT
jgi:hypothetical protein